MRDPSTCERERVYFNQGNILDVASTSPFIFLLWILQDIKGIETDVYPIVDGMGRDFFLTYWDLIADDVLAAFQDMFNTSFMPQMWKEGLVCLIPKGDVVTDEVKGWRPLTLLNTIYKTYAKLLALRLQPFLPDIVLAS